MSLQEPGLEWILTLILLGAIFVLGIAVNRRLVRRPRSVKARRAIDAVWGLMVFALSLWLVLAA